MDVDGTLTDGKIHISSEGELFKSFNVKDGYGIQKLKQNGIIPAIITGRSSSIVAARAAELGIIDVYQGYSDKVQALELLAAKFRCTYDEIAYIGDDENDLPAMRKCGFAACPADACETVKCECDYVCGLRGGEGCVREFAEYIVYELNF